MDKRIYWNQNDIFMPEGTQWHVHVYPDRDVDDEHFLCTFFGRTKDRDFIFIPNDGAVRGVYSSFRIELNQMPFMVFKVIAESKT